MNALRLRMTAERDWRLFDMILSEKACFAVKKSAAEMLQLFKNNELAEGEVYRVTDRLMLSPDTVFCGNNAVIIAEDGIETGGENVSLYKCKLISDNGIISSFDGFTLRECEIESDSVAVLSSGKYFAARNNTIISHGIGIRMTGGSYNSMAAQNTINSEIGVYVDGGYNCVVILNDTQNIICENNTHIYVIKNNLSGNIELKNNKYLICDENTVGGDVIGIGNTHINGDNLNDIGARLEFGVNEELIPHTDNDQFTGMERREFAADIEYGSNITLNDYLREESCKKNVVIIPPGAYTVCKRCDLERESSNTDIYAYGAYFEAVYTHNSVLHINECENVTVNGITIGHTRSCCGQVHVVAKDSDKKKLTAIVSAGFKDGFLSLKSTDTDDEGYNAGSLNMYHRGEWNPYAGGGAIKSIQDNNDGTYTLNLSGTVECDRINVGDIFVCRLARRGFDTVRTDRSTNVRYKDLTVYPVSNSATCRVTWSREVSFERYHSSVPSGYVITKEIFDRYKLWEAEYGVELGVYYDSERELYRGPAPLWGGTGGMEVMDSYEGATVISSKIEALCDDGSNQRGTSSRVAGIVDNCDGTHTVYYKGNYSKIQQIEYSRMTDRSTFNLSSCAPLEIGDTIVAYTADGKVLIKDAKVLTSPVVGNPDGLHMAHSGSGQFCDICGAKIYDDGETYHEMNTVYDNVSGRLSFDARRRIGFGGSEYVTWNTTVYSVKIDSKYVNKALTGEYDFCLNTYFDPMKRVLLDNVGKNCADFTFDNVLMENIKSRGILAKTKGVTVKNCTFRRLTLQALVLGPEEEWSESTISRDILVENCIFDNCAATNAYSKEHRSGPDSEPNITPIDIRGIGITDEQTISKIKPHANMLANNFVIRHNKFINTPNKHMICATGACDITVTDNIFEEREGDGEIIYINGCHNVNVIKNKYSERLQALFDVGSHSLAADIYNCEYVKFENLNIPEKVTLKPTKNIL